VIAAAIGRFTVTRIEEMLTPGFDPAFLFPDYDAAILTAHPQLASASFFDAPTGRLMSSMQSWLVRGEGHVILVDTGCGNGKTRSAPAFRRFHDLNLPFLERLEAAGVQPGDVTHIVNTHLHVDHVGWNTQLRDGAWTPTFPNARYVWGRLETEHWLDPARGLAAQPEAAEVLADSVRPVIEAGRVTLLDDGDTVVPGIRVRLAPGHTAGQLEVWLESEGQSAVFSADVLHQPMQVYRPAWNSRFCELEDVARITRDRLLADAAARDAVVFPSHFGAPHAGRIARAADGYRFVPLAEVAT
jgi:glyoxylase-like metal-dependent hydrolase (beta-lactamase superfamily II)